MKIFLIIVLFAGASLGAYFGYQHYYVETLKLSEVVRKTDDGFANIAVNFLDFNIGLTRHDISQLQSKKDYWLRRMLEVESIADDYLKIEENKKLQEGIMDDPMMKKVLKRTWEKSLEFIKKLLVN